MQSFKFQSWQLAGEIKQKKAISDVLINKILYSKRLLVDHVEALEQYMKEQGATVSTQKKHVISWSSKRSQIEIFTTRNTCLLIGSTIVKYLLAPKFLRLTFIPLVLITGGFSSMYMVKNAFICRNKIVERKLVQLLQTIEDFGNCIRRNMTYFQEIIFLKQQELIESRQIERAWDCITATKEVTEILYEATRKLETDYALPVKYCKYYAPMEELRDCEYFKNNVTDYNPKHIKDFHNIFAYVQSQFLLRLALTISMKTSLSKLNVELFKIDRLVRQLVNEEENHFQNLTIELKKKQQMELDDLNTAKIMQQRFGPIAMLQNSSLKLSACMVAVAGECHALDITLQRLSATNQTNENSNRNQLLAVANNMHAIENALLTCFDDFQRLMLVYNKFLKSKLEDDHHNEKIDCSKPKDLSESTLRIEISSNDTQDCDDFYAYIYDEHDAFANQNHQESKPSSEIEIFNIEECITKTKFKPVLKQLKDRINPIRQVMLEKEREVLSAKGFNVDELFDEENQIAKGMSCMIKKNVTRTDQKDSAIVNEDGGASDDSLGSADLNFGQIYKKRKDCDKFSEMRNFLTEKQAVNLLKLDSAPILSKVTGEEEVLESEC